MDSLGELAQLLAHDRAGTAQRLLQELLRQGGGVKREQGRLCAASSGNPLHQEVGLLSTVQRAFGAAAAIFDGDRLIASVGKGGEGAAIARDALAAGGRPAEADGARAVGTRAPEEAAGTVLGRGTVHESRESFGGGDWYASYAPMRASSGEIYGMTAVYVPLEELRSAVQTLAPALEGSRGLRADDSRRRAAAQRIIQLLDRTTTRLRIVALNAAIISARFGQRTGFDVVAGEMGKLTSEVRDLLGTVEAALLGEEVRDPVLPAATPAAALPVHAPAVAAKPK